MSKRQRFFVELREDEVTVISWKKLLADAERIVDVTRTAAVLPKLPPVAALTPALNADIPEKNTAKNSLKPRRKLKLDVTSSKAIITAPTGEAAERKRRGIPLEDRNINSASDLKLGEKGGKEKANMKTIKDVKHELVEIASKQGKPSVAKGKVHRSVPSSYDSGRVKTSCRTKQAKACFCCSKIINRS